MLLFTSLALLLKCTFVKYFLLCDFLFSWDVTNNSVLCALCRIDPCLTDTNINVLNIGRLSSKLQDNSWKLTGKITENFKLS